MALKGKDRYIFTDRQIAILEKRLNKQELTLTEQSIFYKVIKPKCKGILLLYPKAQKLILNE